MPDSPVVEAQPATAAPDPVDEPELSAAALENEAELCADEPKAENLTTDKTHIRRLTADFSEDEAGLSAAALANEAELEADALHIEDQPVVERIATEPEYVASEPIAPPEYVAPPESAPLERALPEKAAPLVPEAASSEAESFEAPAAPQKLDRERERVCGCFW